MVEWWGGSQTPCLSYVGFVKPLHSFLPQPLPSSFMESYLWWLTGDVERIKFQLSKLFIGLQSGKTKMLGWSLMDVTNTSFFLGHPPTFSPKMFLFLHPSVHLQKVGEMNSLPGRCTRILVHVRILQKNNFYILK